VIRSFYLTADGVVVRDLDRAALKAAVDSRKGALWVDMDDPTAEELEVLGPAVFNLHALTIEDCIHAQQHPKVEDFQDYLYIVFLAWNRAPEGVRLEELDTVLGKNYLVTYHVEPRNGVKAQLDRMDKDPHLVLGHGPDWLLYEIIDRMVDNYNVVVDDVDGRVDRLEADILSKRLGTDTLREILILKRDLQRLFRTIRHQRDVAGTLARDTHTNISKRARDFFRNIHDHVIRVHDVVEGLRDEIGAVRDAYLSMVSNRLNEVVKGLTIVSTLILPMSFITGIYGMNFEWMPFLKTGYGFWVSAGVMAVTGIGMLLWFRRRGWI